VGIPLNNEYPKKLGLFLGKIFGIIVRIIINLILGAKEGLLLHNFPVIFIIMAVISSRTADV
jgi:hypothetical protein